MLTGTKLSLPWAPGNWTLAASSHFTTPRPISFQSQILPFLHKSGAVLSCSGMSDSLRPHGLQPSRFLYPWGLSRKEYWSGLPCPPPGDLPNPRIPPRYPSLQPDFLTCLSHQGSPRILEWGAYPFSRASSRPRNRTRVSCLVGRFFPRWVTREAPTNQGCCHNIREPHFWAWMGCNEGGFWDESWKTARTQMVGERTFCEDKGPWWESEDEDV